MGENRFKGYRYHNTDHQKLSGNLAYMSAPFEVKGAIADIRVIAGLTRQQKGNTDGALSFGALYPAKEADVLEWIVNKSKTKKAGQALWDSVKRTGVVSVMKRSGVVKVADWASEQEGPATANTQHKRDQRERERVDGAIVKLTPLSGQLIPEDDVVSMLQTWLRMRKDVARRTLDGLVAVRAVTRTDSGDIQIAVLTKQGSSAPPSLSPPTDNGNLSTGNADMSGKEPDMSARQRSRQKEETNVSLSTDNLSTGEREGGAELRSLLMKDPVRAAQVVTKGFGSVDQRIFGAKLRDFKAAFNGNGLSKFAGEVEMLAAELRQGEHAKIIARKELPRFLTSRLSKHLQKARS